jgi:hypothetical protein
MFMVLVLGCLEFHRNSYRNPLGENPVDPKTSFMHSDDSPERNHTLTS